MKKGDIVRVIEEHAYNGRTVYQGAVDILGLRSTEGTWYIEYGYIPESKLEIIEDWTEGLIAKFRWEFEFARLTWERHKDLWEMNQAKPEADRKWMYRPQGKPRINFTVGWDDVLIQRVQALSDKGFYISKFNRNMKIFMRLPADQTRPEIMQKVIESVGLEWKTMSFKPFWIAWQAEKHWRW